MQENLNLGLSLQSNNTAFIYLARESVRRNYTFWRFHGVSTQDTIVPLEHTFMYSDKQRTEVVMTWENALAWVQQMPSARTASICATGKDQAAVDTAIELIEAQLPKAEPKEKQVSLQFWTWGVDGPESFSRPVDVPHWEEIKANYPPSTRKLLNRLMTDFKPSHGGQLLLWHGTPGTGKTYAIRALMREWQQWCNVEYVVDPEQFFGAHANYLINVLLSTRRNDYYDAEVSEADEVELPDGVANSELGSYMRRRRERVQKWRLLIFEDTGELLSADAKQRSGQGLARLLNTVDGLIGQGLKVLCLITTNEDLGRLHAAVSRPGRTAAKVSFERFTATEAAEWLEAHEVTGPTTTATLAELYARAEGRSAATSTPLIGFAPDGKR